MKKQLLALAIGSMVIAPSVALADKGPTLYGKVNVTYGVVDDGTDDAWDLKSNDSRLGVKGELDLDVQDLSAVYQAEFGMDVADGNGLTSQRNIFGGFKHRTAGTLIAGKFDTPFKKAQGKIDQFGDLNKADIKNVVGGENRVGNIVQYSSPKLADALTLNVAVIPGEDPGVDDKDGPADAVSASVVFDNGLFYGALAYDSEVTSDIYDLGSDTETDALRAVGKVNIENFEIGALYQMSESSESVSGVDYEDSSYILSGAVNLDRLKLKVQYGITDYDATDDDRSLMAVGADYKVGKSSKVFAYYAAVEEDNGPLDDSTFAIGFDHKFSM